MNNRHIYDQKTGMFRDADQKVIYLGYAGLGAGVNNPAMENVPNIGPLPRGFYTIGKLVTTDPRFGPTWLALTPSPGNKMFGRGGFLIHWNTHDANPNDMIFPNDASHGCIILYDGSFIARIAASPVNLLEVV